MSRTSDADFWEQVYQRGDYLDAWDYAYPSQELIAVVGAQVAGQPGTALDIGCGAGREAVFLAQCGFQVIAVDISARALELGAARAAEAGVTVDWRQGSFFDLPVDDASVDFINDRGAFHLVADDERSGFAAEIHRVLKPGGVFFLRGASIRATETLLVPLTEAAIDQHFPSTAFSRGPMLPIQLIADSGVLDAQLVVLRKR